MAASCRRSRRGPTSRPSTISIERALAQAGLRLEEVDGIAAAAGPGLIGGVIVGLTTAKALALVTRKPLLAVNHLEGHALTARLTDGIGFPYLLLLVSGGHTQLLAVKGVGDYVRLGTTVDDAIGEAFDKVAKLLGLPYPGGPEVEKAAAEGDPERFALPRPMLGRPEPNFSLSGLKTALRIEAERIVPLTETRRRRSLRELPGRGDGRRGRPHARRIARLPERRPDTRPPSSIAGGVAANQTASPRAPASRGRGGPAPPRAASRAVRRQRRDRRLGGARAAAARAHRRHDGAGARPLASRRGPRRSRREGLKVPAVGIRRIGVVGGGAWGTALANAAALAGREVVLWMRDAGRRAQAARRAGECARTCRACGSKRA